MDWLDPVLPLSPGRVARRGIPLSNSSHFLTGLLERAEWAREIHVVLDNLSAYKTKDVERFLAEHRPVRFHFTPTYS